MKIYVVTLAAIMLFSGCAILQARHHDSVVKLSYDHIEVSQYLIDKARTHWASEYNAVDDRITVSQKTLDDGSIEISALRWNPEMAGTTLPFIIIRLSKHSDATIVAISEQRSIIDQSHVYLDQTEKWLEDFQQLKANASNKSI